MYRSNVPNRQTQRSARRRHLPDVTTRMPMYYEQPATTFFSQCFSYRDFYEFINSFYGSHHSRNLKQFDKTLYKFNRFNEQKTFLIRCRKFDIIPKHLYNLHNTFKGFHFSKFSNQSKFVKQKNNFINQILNLEIDDLHFKLFQLQNELTMLSQFIYENFNVQHIEQFCYITTVKNERFLNNLKITHEKKFQLLLKNKSKVTPMVNNNLEKTDHLNWYPNYLQMNNDKWIKNLSTVNIPPNVEHILSLGPKFGYEKNNLEEKDIFGIIKEFESQIGNIATDQKNYLRNSLVNMITDKIHYQNAYKPHLSFGNKLFQQHLEETQIFLKKHKDILVTKADKGSISVILDKSVYIQSTCELLSDVNTYEKQDTDPIHKVLKSLNDICKDLLNNNCIDRSIFYFIRKTYGNLSRMYTLPKIHKPTLSFRPIISTVDSPTYNFDKFFARFLKNNIPESKYNVKNSIEFRQRIKGQIIPTDHVMISLDVTSLFTNITKDMVINAIEKHYASIYNGFNEKLFLPLNSLIDCIKFIFDNTYFKFNNDTFKQVKGSPMGGCTSPIFADIAMRDLETYVFSRIDYIKFYNRYVDDIFCVIPFSKIDETLDIFNSYDPNLQFTIELEQNKTINFLDVTIINDNSVILTNWYQKSTYSGRILNFMSIHPLHQKRAMIFNLVDKALLLSDHMYHDDNIALLKSILIKNSYPGEFIDLNVNKRIETLNSNPNNDNSEKQFDKIIKIQL